VDMLGHPQLDAGGFPARAVEHEHELLGGTGSRLAREGGQFHCKDRDTDGGWQIGQMKEGPTRGGMHKADQVAPGKAVLHGGDGALANWRPDAPEQRFEANAMLVGGPQFDLRLREGGGDRS